MMAYHDRLKAGLLDQLGKGWLVFMPGWDRQRRCPWRGKGAVPSALVLHHTAAAATSSTNPAAAVEDLAVKVQPRNGGAGWLDVHHKLDTVITRQGEVVDDVRYLRGRLDHHIDSDHKGD